MKIFSVIAALVLLAAVATNAQTTNSLSDGEIQGRALAQKILQQWPADNFTNTGVLKIKDAKGRHTDVSVKFKVTVTATNWTSLYDSGETWMATTHALEANSYRFQAANEQEVNLSGNQLTLPYAGSDFWLTDLGLEFFHWPQQKVLKKEVHRSCGCTVLESTNPDPDTNGYSRVVSWIDSDSLGIVEAYAYDSKGKLLKDFYPKDLKKVNGQYQVETMVMENVQASSRTRLEFDPKK